MRTRGSLETASARGRQRPRRNQPSTLKEPPRYERSNEMTAQQKARATLSTPGKREIVTERVFAAPRGRVWAAFTDPELIPHWWGLRGNPTVVDALDLRPGGAWRFRQVNDDGSHA